MREKPNLPDDAVVACLWDGYGLRGTRITFLPIGADPGTAVYRVIADDGAPYFLKLRRSAFDEVTVAIPRLLADQGIAAIIAPIRTTGGRLWAELDHFAVILSPYVDGLDGFGTALSDRQWHSLGEALRAIHSTAVPAALGQRIPHESYDPCWRDAVHAFQAQAEGTPFDEPAAARVAELLRVERARITALVGHAERLAGVVARRSPSRVLCHGDIHAGNILVGADGQLHVVDWDTVALAPRERDLELVGAGVGGGWSSARERPPFARGYGPVELDPDVLGYYRYERIVEDVAVCCQQLLGTTDGGENRAQELELMLRLFQSGGLIDRVLQDS
jgi:spectinomycin phosphotransferase